MESLRPAFDSWPDGLLVVSKDGSIVDANPAAARILGSGVEDVRNGRMQDYAPPGADGEEVWTALREANTREAGISMTRPDGTVIEIEWASTPAITPGRCIVLLRDVTDRNRTAREASFRAELLDHVEASVVAVDPNGVITHWNKAAERLYGWTREEVLGRPARDVVVPAEARSTAAEVWATVREGRVWEGITKIRRREGEPLSVWNLDAPIRDASGAVEGYVGIAVDITDQKATFHGFLMASVWGGGLIVQTVGLLLLGGGMLIGAIRRRAERNS